MRNGLAEFLGTFVLVFAGTGAIVVDHYTGGHLGVVGVALTFGLVVLAMIYTFGDVSGAHLNPAVTLGFAVSGRFAWSRVPFYLLAQCAGAIAASLVVRLLFPADAKLGATVPAGTASQSFVLEILLTFILMMTILSVSTGAREKGVTAGIAVGAVVGLEAMFAGPISGASMNPARSLGPSLVSGQWEFLWIYLTAPVLGALLAVPVCHGIHGRNCCGQSLPPPDPDSSHDLSKTPDPDSLHR